MRLYKRVCCGSDESCLSDADSASRFLGNDTPSLPSFSSHS